jgi:hypothetical protein
MVDQMPGIINYFGILSEKFSLFIEPAGEARA